MAELPKYKSHKVVGAMKIGAVRWDANGATLFAVDCGAQVQVSSPTYERLGKMAGNGESADLAGGYYVRYRDGYESWSPAEAFESGYKPLQDALGATDDAPAQPSSGKSKIAGYRALNEAEIDMMNLVKGLGQDLERMVKMVQIVDDPETKRWCAIAKTHFQQGLMALTRAVARPEFF